MPTIVKHYDKKTGKTRVYESTPHYDPITKQSRPKRKYLGTLDPETNELIPSSGRRGRRSPANSKDIVPDAMIAALSNRITVLEQTISARDAEISGLLSEIETLKTTLNAYKNACSSIFKTLASLPENP